MLDLTAAVVAGNLDLKVMAGRAIGGITISGIVGMCGGCILPISLLSMVFLQSRDRNRTRNIREIEVLRGAWK